MDHLSRQAPGRIEQDIFLLMAIAFRLVINHLVKLAKRTLQAVSCKSRFLMEINIIMCFLFFADDSYEIWIMAKRTYYGCMLITHSPKVFSFLGFHTSNKKFDSLQDCNVILSVCLIICLSICLPFDMSIRLTRPFFLRS